MAMTPEGKVKKEIKNLLHDLKAWYYMPVQTGRGTNGVPDFVCCIQGTFVGIEAKAPGKKATTTPLQDMQLETIQRAGGVSIVACSAYDVTVALVTAKLLPGAR